MIYRPNVNIWLVLQVWDLWVGSLISSILMLNIDTHTLTYIPGPTSVWTWHNIWWTSCEPWQVTSTLIQWSKVCRCYSSIFLDQTPMFERCVVRYGSKNTHHKNMCLKEITLRLQMLLKFSKFYRQHNWEDICIHLRNQHTCTFIITTLTNKGRPKFQSNFWKILIMHLLTKYKVWEAKLINGQWRRRKTNWITLKWMDIWMSYRWIIFSMHHFL